jgi:hypothetical protein
MRSEPMLKPGDFVIMLDGEEPSTVYLADHRGSD